MSLLRKAKRKLKKALGLNKPPVRISETSKVRESLARFCEGDGMDVGYGGDPITESAICMDLPKKYAAYQSHPQHLHGDALDLHWFRDDVLDYVYSSHVLEDFEDTASALKEWLRVVKPRGRVILFLPDEQTYRKHCSSKGLAPNVHHIHDDFGPEYLKQIVEGMGGAKVIHERFPVEVYSFEMVIEKVDTQTSS